VAKRYTVYVDDNFHYMDESERYKLGEFEDCQSATAACKQIVDQFLDSCDAKSGADEMFGQYTGFGEDPWISSDDPNCKFSAWDYAKERCRELAQK
jgi:hypothetical protein